MTTPAGERNWAAAAHWLALVAVLGGFTFLGPLLVLLLKGDESPLVRRHAMESLNFQISMLIYWLMLTLALLAAAAFAVRDLLPIGFLMLIAVGVAWLVLTVTGAVRASIGEDFRYPLTIRMVR